MKIMYAIGMKRMGDYYKSGQYMNNAIIEYVNAVSYTHLDVYKRQLTGALCQPLHQEHEAL